MLSSDLLTRIHSLPLFSRLGAPISDVSVQRIVAWDQWGGPEEPLVQAIHFHQQSLHDAVVSAAEEPRWKAMLDALVRQIAPLVPFDDTEDAWHPPNMATWHAAWAFALEAEYSTKNLKLPEAIGAQVFWFELGHWPCSLTSQSGLNSKNGYIIY